MPTITHLSVSSLRNISAISLDPNPLFNCFVGPNGAGKTSILESIALVAHGRSFRTHKFRSVIADSEKDLTVFARVRNDGETHDVPVGIQRSRKGDNIIKMAGQRVSSSSELAKSLPLLLVDAKSFRLLEGSPKDRRKFVDWLVFHVKHGFSEDWRGLTHCYKQRNALLRRDKIQYSDLLPWDIEIEKLSLEIDKARKGAFALFSASLESIIERLDASGIFQGLGLSLSSGWKQDFGKESISAQLQGAFEKDSRYGYSTLGPHKADLKITINGKEAGETLSRGQQKLLICALHIAQAKTLLDNTGMKTIFSIDDLPSELDKDNQKNLGGWLKELGGQVFATGIQEDFASLVWPASSQKECTVFHVKHGSIETTQTENV